MFWKSCASSTCSVDFNEFWLYRSSVVFGLMCPPHGDLVLFCYVVLLVVLCIIEQLIKSFVSLRWRPACRGDFRILYNRINMSRWFEKHVKIRCFLNAVRAHMLWVRLLPCRVDSKVIARSTELVLESNLRAVLDLKWSKCEYLCAVPANSVKG